METLLLTANAARLLLRLCLFAALLCFASGGESSIHAQQATEKWERVYTGDDSIIEINTAHLSFEPNQILRVGFRTVFAKPQDTGGPGSPKYKVRLETIDFKTIEKRYRFWQTTLVDPNGKTLQTYYASTNEWRVIKVGGLMERLLAAARALPPFGPWKVTDYRFAEGSLKENTPSAELARLIGTRVRVSIDRIDVGSDICSAPVYEEKQFSKEDLSRQYGIALESVGIKTESVAGITMNCQGAPPSLLLKVRQDQMLILWKGVFLVLQKER